LDLYKNIKWKISLIWRCCQHPCDNWELWCCSWIWTITINVGFCKKV